jgi:O-acetylhomoserine (thiol)-lyase
VEAVFHHKAAGYAYTRVANPTVAAFEQRIRELEGGNAAVACSSGMSAVTLSLLNMLCAGDEIIACAGIYGGSIDLLEDLEKFGITTHYVRHMTPEEMEPFFNEHTRAVFGELIGNPSLEIMDVKRTAAAAHAHGVPLIVDATTATPYLCTPLSLGADILIHSTTKYINGSGDAVSGVIVDSAKFHWDFDRFRALDGYRKFRDAAYTVRLRTDLWENMGGCMAPVSAYLNTIGLETLGLRMERICSSALLLAKALRTIPGIREVNYPGLPDHLDHALCESELKGKGGGIITFRAGSKERAFRLLNALRYCVRATSLGDVRTLVIHPASTLYIRSSSLQKEAAGVFDDTIRVSVGIEDAEDLIEDFTQAAQSLNQNE